MGFRKRDPARSIHFWRQDYDFFLSSSGVVQVGCGACRSKKKNPEKRIYKERTIEVGVLVDSYLWHKMKVVKSNIIV